MKQLSALLIGIALFTKAFSSTWSPSAELSSDLPSGGSFSKQGENSATFVQTAFGSTASTAIITNGISIPFSSVDAVGNVFVVWAQPASGGAAILGAVFNGIVPYPFPVASNGASKATVFIGPQNVTNISGSSATNSNAFPRVAAFGVGNATAFWIQNGNTLNTSNFSPNTQSWSGVTSISSIASQTITYLDASFNFIAGIGVAVWVQLNNGLYNIQSSTYTLSTGTWSVPINVLTNSTTQAIAGPHVTVDVGGKATVVWAQNGSQFILAATLPKSGSWSTPPIEFFPQIPIP